MLNNQTRFISLFVEELTAGFILNSQTLRSHSSDTVIDKIARMGNAMSDTKQSTSSIVGEKLSLVIAVVNGMRALKTSKKASANNLNNNLEIPQEIKNDPKKFAERTAQIIYNRFENAIVELENSEVGLNKLVNFFVAAVLKNKDSLKMPGLTWEEKIYRCIFLLKKGDHLFNESLHGKTITTKKARLKCRDSDKSWTIEGLIWRSPAAVKNEPNKLWIREGEKNDRSDKYPKQILQSSSQAEREGFIRKISDSLASSVNPLPAAVSERENNQPSTTTNSSPIHAKSTYKYLIGGTLSLVTLATLVGVFAVSIPTQKNTSSIDIKFTI